MQILTTLIDNQHCDVVCKGSIYRINAGAEKLYLRFKQNSHGFLLHFFTLEKTDNS